MAKEPYLVLQLLQINGLEENRRSRTSPAVWSQHPRRGPVARDHGYSPQHATRTHVPVPASSRRTLPRHRRFGGGDFPCRRRNRFCRLVVFQEARSEHALSALRMLAEPFARVIRRGTERRIIASELVRGDVIVAVEGERIPADGVLIGGDMLSVDESMLSGESVPVTKRIAETADEPQTIVPGGEHTPFLLAGTLIVRGQGVLRLTSGRQTQIGRIGASLSRIQTEPTPLQQTSARLVVKLSLAAFGFCTIVALTYVLFGMNGLRVHSQG